MAGKTNSSRTLQVALTVAVTPSNTTDLARGETRGIYVGVSGNVAVTYPCGATDTLNNLAAGMFHPISVVRILSTGTTATGIKACY